MVQSRRDEVMVIKEEAEDDEIEEISNEQSNSNSYF